MGREWRLRRGVWVSYLAAGVALAVARVALMVWVNQRQIYSEMTETVLHLSWGLYPEAPLFAWVFGHVGFTRSGHYLVFGSLLALGSFLMATPILLVGWLAQRRRSR
jgi:hypothetical protein